MITQNNSTKNVLIIGYYHRKNLGDDAFEYIFKKLFESSSLSVKYTISNIDDIEEIDNDTDVILFGGGDLINDYFMKKLTKLTNNGKICPIYCISVGIPYPQLINVDGYFDNFDFIIHRNQPDYNKLFAKFGKNRVKCYPDLTNLLPKYSKSTTDYLIESNTKKIGICLSKSIYSPKDPSLYLKIIEELAVFFIDLADMKRNNVFGCVTKNNKYNLYFVPFSTDSNPNQDDREINKDVFNKIKEIGNYTNIHLIEKELPIDEIIPIFNDFDFTVCTRFHANVFSVLTNTPMLSIYSSRKVDNLLEELHLSEYAYKMKVNPEYLYPTEIDSSKLLQKFLKIEFNESHIKDILKKHNRVNQEKMKEFIITLENLIYYSPTWFTREEISNLAIEKTNSINDIIKNLNLSLGKKSDVPKIAEIINYTLLKNRTTEYTYGLEQNIIKCIGKEECPFNMVEACEWILNYDQENHLNLDKYLKNTTPLSDRNLNVEYIKQHGLQGYHRSGWNYVLSHIQNLHSNEDSAPIFDSYLDKTFGWDYEFLSDLKILPYTKSWIGIFHHTPSEDYSVNNLTELFKKPNFLQSLHQCKGLIVFSSHLKDWILKNIPYSIDEYIPIHVMYHPTLKPRDSALFNWTNFSRNETKKVVHIGAWLRDSYSIYKLKVPSHFEKIALKGKDMNNHFIDTNQLNDITEQLLEIGCSDQDRKSVV